MQKDTRLETSTSQMRKGLIEFCILLIISRGRVYASEIIAELKQADLIVVEGTLYPLLSRLHSEKMLDYSWEESKAGPPRKYYALTAEGKDLLASLKKTWESLSGSIDTLIK